MSSAHNVGQLSPLRRAFSLTFFPLLCTIVSVRFVLRRFRFIYKGGCNMVFQNVPRVRRCAFWTVVFSFLAYGYRFFSAGFGGDAALVSLSGQAAYQASLGRFLQPVYWLIRGSLVVPSVVGLFTTVFLFLTGFFFFKKATNR